MFFSFFSRFFFFSILTVSLPISFVFADTITKEATFYSDAFEGSRTANGDTFHQASYSAALCDIPLGSYVYASYGSTGVVLDANDRPNCSRYPDVIDISRDAFERFAPLGRGRLSGVQVTTLGIAPTDIEKGFLPLDTFEHLGVRLTSQVPTVLFSGEGITIRGKVIGESKNVTIALFREQENLLKNPLISVEKDGTFQAHMLLPKEVGSYIFIVAKGNGFSETSQYATLALIDKNNLFYPSLPTERYKVLPRISTIQDTKSIILPDTLAGDIVISQGNAIFRTSGKTLMFSNTGLKSGKAQVQMSGYLLSTPSPLDRRASVNSLFSGTVIIARTHESVGRNLVTLRQRKTTTSLSFRVPDMPKIRSTYYLTLPSGAVQELYFSRELVGADNFLIPGKKIILSLPTASEGIYLIEAVKEDGVAYFNLPVTQGKVWPILQPYSPEEGRYIEKNSSVIKKAITDKINELRTSLGRPVLSGDESLSELAQAKSDDMANRNYVAHKDPDGLFIEGLAQKIGLKIQGQFRENIGFGMGAIGYVGIQDGLEESGSHRYAMLVPEYTKIGIGYTRYEDKIYIVEVIGK